MAFIAISSGIIQKYGYPALAAATIISGAVMVLIGALRMGGLVKFIPHAVIGGFSSGIAITVLASRLGDAFGLPVSKSPADLVSAIAELAHAIGAFNPWAFATAVAAFAVIAVFARRGGYGMPGGFGGWIPGSLVALVAGSLAVALLGIPVETVGSRYGDLSPEFPALSFPPFSLALIRELLSPAISLALIASVESLSSAVVADGMTGGRCDPNRVLFAQGAANLVIPVLGGIPSAGWVSRTVCAVRGGARSPVAAFVHAIAMLALFVFLGRFVAFVPIPVIAALVVFASLEMVGLPALRAILRGRASDAIVFCATLLLTAFLDLVSAVSVGILLAAFFSLREGTSGPTVKEMQGELRALRKPRTPREPLCADPKGLAHFAVPKGVAVFELSIPLSFGALQRFEQHALLRRPFCASFVLRMRNAIYVDEGDLRVIGELASDCKKRGIAFLIADIHTQPYMLAAESGFENVIGKENFFGNLGEALARAESYVSSRSLSRREYEQPQ